MSTQRLPAQVIDITGRVARTRRKDTKLAAAAPTLARLLLTLEDEWYADARSCPFCEAPEDDDEDSLALRHGPDCELDLVLRTTGIRERKGR